MSLVLNVEILGEFKKLTTATQGAQSSLSNLANRATKVSQTIGRVIGALGITLGFRAVVEGAKDSIAAASDLEQQFGALDSVFKDIAPEMKTFSKDMNRIGLSSAEAARQSVLLGSMIKGAGFSLKDTGKQTKSLVTLAGDLAATFGGPTSDAVRAISALLRNEYDPIERYGVSIKKSDINARLAAEGLDKLTGEARKQAELQAGLALLFEKTADAQGQAARESETYAAKMGQLQAKMTDLQVEIGNALLPILIDLGEWFLEVIPDIQAFFEELTDPTTVMGKKWEGMIGILANTAEAIDNLMSVVSGAPSKGSGLMDWVTTLAAGMGQIVFYLTRQAELFQALMRLDFGRIGELAGNYGADYNEFVRQQNLAYDPQQGIKPGQVSTPKQNVTININKGNVTAKEIANAVNKGAKTTGSPSIQQIAIRKALK
jgi:hypothetical protein